MKRTLYLFVALILPVLSFANDQSTATFAKGNVLYTKGQYKEALSAYQQILRDGYQSAALYYNMGNACYKLDSIPSAILYYEKAHKLSPGDEDIIYNIRFANQKTTDKIDEIPDYFLARWWKAFILSFSISTLSTLSVILIVIASGIFMGYLFSDNIRIKKASFYTSLIILAIGLITVFMAGMQSSYFSGHKQAIVFSNSVNVKSGPADKLGTLFIIHDGTKVNVLENSNGWLRVRLGNGNEGWMKELDAKEI